MSVKNFNCLIRCHYIGGRIVFALKGGSEFLGILARAGARFD
jgi:hypothetical protein